tara:strand:- start:85 stop:675 length:591 start_codon:yes stop_codon:yes gene_type:complete
MFNKLNTNITVEKIDTTETATKNNSSKSQNSSQKSSQKSSSSKLTSKSTSKSTQKSTQKTSSTKLSQKSIKNKNTQETKLTNNIIKEIETLEDLPLVLSNISANTKDYYIHTDTLLKSKKPKKSIKSTKYTLVFPKTQEVDTSKYNIVNKYVKKNYNYIVNFLYDKNLLKNKSSPYRLVFHIYVNYLHEDLNIIFE